MDLPVETKMWRASDLEVFGYGERKAVVIRKLEGGEYMKETLHNNEDWERWFSPPPEVSANKGDLESGFHVLLCSRAPPAFEKGLVQHLPLTKSTWGRLTRDFHVSLNIKRAIGRLVPCFSSIREHDATLGKPKMSFMVRMSASLTKDLALSTTYIPSIGSTFAVVYGCDNEQMEDIEKRIRRADDQLRHPLLMPGILAEMERKMLVEAVEDLVDKFTLRSEPLNSTPDAESWSPDSDADGRMAQKHLNLCMESRDLINHISAVKRQISKLLKEIDIVGQEMESLNPLPRVQTGTTTVSDIGARMKRRVEDIMIEYDDKIDDCDMMICNTSLAMQTVWNHIARQDSQTNTKISKDNATIAAQTKVESAQMRTIALLTMIYLPLSSVAAIFSMDMFNWEAIEGESIVSKHIWLFAVLATGLTLLTVTAWFMGTRREKAMAADLEEYYKSPQRHSTFEYV